MALVRSGGGNEKVTINGEKVNKKLSLIQTINYARELPCQGLEYPQNTSSFHVIYASGMTYDKENKRYIISGAMSNKPDAIYILNDTNAIDWRADLWEKKLSTSYQGICDIIARKKEIYILLEDGSLRKLSKDLNSSTLISTCPKTSLNYLFLSAHYIEELDSFYMFDSNNTRYSYNFTNNKWTQIPTNSNNFGRKGKTVKKDDKIYYYTFANTFITFNPNSSNYTTINTNLRADGRLACYNDTLFFFGTEDSSPSSTKSKNIIFKQQNDVNNWTKVGFSLQRVSFSYPSQTIISNHKPNCFTVLNANDLIHDTFTYFEQGYPYVIE